MAYTAWSVSQSEVPDTAKWNLLGGNDAHFYSFLGDNLEWQSWTPSYLGLTIGNGIVTAAYTKVGRTIYGRLKLERGTTTSFTGGALFSVPEAMHSDYLAHVHHVGVAYIEDYVVTGHSGVVSTEASNPHYLYVRGGESTLTAFVQNTSLSNSVPFAWAAGDYFDCHFVYESAA